jgi:hypothetical protein
MTRQTVRVSGLGVGLALLLVLGAPVTARAATISLGWLSFDQFIAPIPGDPASVGTNAFNIFNDTGGFALLPANPTSPVSLLGAILQLTPSSGVPQDVALGTIDPGTLGDGAGNPFVGLQFADTLTFTSAVFTATLSTSTFQMLDGSTFQAFSPDLLFTLASPGGLAPNPLSAEFTGVEFLVDGDVLPSSVPEPSTLLFLGSGLAMVLRSAIRGRARA